MRQNGIMIILVVAAAISLSAGCNNQQNQTVNTTYEGAPRQTAPITGLIASAQPPIPDLPIPLGFNLDEPKSRDYALSGARFVDHTYKGKGDKLAVKRFFERQMPINRWVLSTAMFVRGDIMLDFEKEMERCRVVISDSNFLFLFPQTYIKVQLWTSGRVEVPTAQE